MRARAGGHGGTDVNLFALVPARSWLMAAAAVLASLVGGAFSAGLLALINGALNNPDRSQSLLAIGFAGLVVGKVATNAAARLLLNDFTQRMISELCRNLSRRVLATSARELADGTVSMPPGRTRSRSTKAALG